MTLDGALQHLGGAYFHQDYDADGQLPPDIVRSFAQGTEIQTIQIFYSYLAERIIMGISEAEAGKFWLDEVDSMYEPDKEGINYTQWLKTVVLIVGDVLRQRWATE